MVPPQEDTMGTIRDKMTGDLDLRGFASTTKKEYLQRAQNFVAYHQRPPTELGEHEIREFLLYLVNEKKTGSATQHMYIAAIKFLYATTLARPEVVAKIPWPKRSQLLPDILTGEEVERLFQQIASIKHRAILMTAYGAGLRISEACSLQISDLDSKRMLIHVHEGKRSRRGIVRSCARRRRSSRHAGGCAGESVRSRSLADPSPYSWPDYCPALQRGRR
jgi:site-specific recombinase XerD